MIFVSLPLGMDVRADGIADGLKRILFRGSFLGTWSEEKSDVSTV